MILARCRHRRKTRRLGRRVFLLCLILSLLLPALFPPISASAAEAPPTGEVHNVLLINLENNLTLQEKAADTLIYPSSSVKIMTGLLASRRLVDRLDEEVTLTAAMLSGVEGRRMNPPLAEGEVLTVHYTTYDPAATAHEFEVLVGDQCTEIDRIMRPE